MEWWQALIIGVVQGVTEFLPVSSDGHIALAGFLLGIKDMPLSTVVLAHAGTLLATLIVMGADIRDVFRHAAASLATPKEFLASDDGRLVLGIVIASVPTAIVGLTMEHRVEDWAHVPWIVGVCFVVTGLVLLTTIRQHGTRTSLHWWQYAVVGLAQGVAVLPGVSRSGCTIAAAMALGLTGPAAFRLSFLMSLPAVGGALLLEFLKPGALEGFDPEAAEIAIIALVSGMFALALLRKLVARGRFWSFAIYVIPLGIALTIWGLLHLHPAT